MRICAVCDTENVGILALEVYFPTRFVSQVSSTHPTQQQSVGYRSRACSDPRGAGHEAKSCRRTPSAVSRKAAPLLPSSQAELESRDGCPGKYTRGLGQTGLAFCDDREDITTVMLTALRQLLNKYEVDPSTIGRLEVRRQICLR